MHAGQGRSRVAIASQDCRARSVGGSHARLVSHPHLSSGPIRSDPTAHGCTRDKLSSPHGALYPVYVCRTSPARQRYVHEPQMNRASCGVVQSSLYHYQELDIASLYSRVEYVT
jgi:hypothetical protein